MTDPIGSAAQANTTQTNTSEERNGPGGLLALADRDTFLRLLVVQVQNQDPLNPQQPVEFVGQLAQFSQLETLLSMRSSLEAIEAGFGQPEPGGDAAEGA